MLGFNSSAMQGKGTESDLLLLALMDTLMGGLDKKFIEWDAAE